VLKALFSVPRDGKVSKPEAIFCSPRMEKKTMRTLFSTHVDGKVSKPAAIFHPPLTKKSYVSKKSMMLFSFHHGYMKID